MEAVVPFKTLTVVPWWTLIPFLVGFLVLLVFFFKQGGKIAELRETAKDQEGRLDNMWGVVKALADREREARDSRERFREVTATRCTLDGIRVEAGDQVLIKVRPDPLDELLETLKEGQRESDPWDATLTREDP